MLDHVFISSRDRQFFILFSLQMFVSQKNGKTIILNFFETHNILH